jgi:hypothetical protein
MQRIQVSPKKIFLLLLIFICSITSANIAGQYYKDFASTQNPFVLKTIEFIDFNSEKDNLLDWYQSSTLLFCSLLLATTAFILKSNRKTDRLFWENLAWLFLYLSIEEVVNINNHILLLLNYAFNVQDFLNSYLLLATLVLICILLAVEFSHLFHLPLHIRRLFICAGFIYVVGAIVLDALGPMYVDLHNNPLASSQKFVNSMLITAEELFEMVGISIFIYAILSYLKSDSEAIQAENAEITFQVVFKQ